jgi:non-heme chloroperoxidase
LLQDAAERKENMTGPEPAANAITSRRDVLMGSAAMAAIAALSSMGAANSQAASTSPDRQKGENSVNTTITTKDGTEIYYKDWGSGQQIVFSHGWPLSADDWDAQMIFFINHGYRVIAHDRRVTGAPANPATDTIWITTPTISRR